MIQEEYLLLLSIDDDNDDKKQLKDYINRLFRFINNTFYKSNVANKSEFCSNFVYSSKNSNNILSYLKEFVNDSFDDNKKAVFKRINTMLDLIEDNNLEQLDYVSFNFIVNIYIMLKAYKFYSSNYPIFLDLLNLATENLIDSNLDNTIFLSSKWKVIIDNIIENPNYPKNEDIYNNIIKFLLLNLKTLKYWDYDHYQSVIKRLNDANKIYSILENLSNNGIKYKSIDYDVFEDVLNGITKLSSKIADHLDSICFNSNFLVNGRIEYINEKLDDLNYKKTYDGKLENEMIIYLSNIKEGFFDFLDQYYSGKKDFDSFTYYMDMCFDSDTFYELEKKAEILINASACWERGEINSMKEELINISNGSCKKKLSDGTVVDYQNEFNSKIIKPRHISNRVIELYSKLGFEKETIENYILDADSFYYIDSVLDELYDEMLKDKKLNEKTDDNADFLSDESQFGVNDNEARKIEMVNDDSHETKTNSSKKHNSSFQKIKSIFSSNN